jgi:hypothetical protein
MAVHAGGSGWPEDDLQEVKSMADGRVFSERCQERKLIDATGDFQDAVDLTANSPAFRKANLIRNTTAYGADGCVDGRHLPADAFGGRPSILKSIQYCEVKEAIDHDQGRSG